MRLLLFFDLPVITANDRKNYKNFIKFLTNEGYIRVQYSVYSKLCINTDSAETASKKLLSNCPIDGNVRFIIITEKQYQKVVNVNGTYSLQEKISTTDRTIMIGGMNENQDE